MYFEYKEQAFVVVTLFLFGQTANEAMFGSSNEQSNDQKSWEIGVEMHKVLYTGTWKNGRRIWK